MKKTIIKKGMYFDSVKLMLVTNDVSAVDGVINAAVVMGTDLNKDSLKRTGLDTVESESATANDLIISIETTNDISMENAISALENSINQTKKSNSNANSNPKSIESAIKKNKDSNICLISIPGEFASDEAEDALKKGLHVMLFSDNVTVEQELHLKNLAKSKNLLMMGPDCGTARINSVPLCFSNVVKDGNIGIVGASGTGSQELMTLIDKFGGGVSQLIGTGGRDLKEDIGGIMTLMAIEALEKDHNTQVILLISKPPSKNVAEKIINFVNGSISKPVVINFIGLDSVEHDIKNVYFAPNTKSAAINAINLAGIEYNEQIQQQNQIATRNGFIRGLYSGGTLAYESLYLLGKKYGDIKSNLTKNNPVENIHDLIGNAIVDFGEDEYTVGRPHPMIDSTLRKKIFVEQLNCDDVAVIMIDIVLGYGSNNEPQKAFVDALKESTNTNLPIIIANICGSYNDPQNYENVCKDLESVGIIVKHSNVDAINYALSVLGGKN